MSSPLRFALASLSLAAAASPAFAVPLTSIEVLQQFNLVTFSNLATSSDVEGRTWVGGNAQGGNFVQRPLPASSYAGVTVIGDLNRNNVDGGGIYVGGNASNLNVNNGGGVVIGNATSINFNGGTPSFVGGTKSGVNQNSGNAATIASNATLQGFADAAQSTDFRAVMTDASSQLKGVAANSSYSIVGNLATFDAAPVGGVAVFDILDDTSFFAGVGEIKFNLNGATSVLINTDVAGTVAPSINFLEGQAVSLGGQILWNFSDATTLNFGAQWGGSVLAPLAHVTTVNNIEGTLISETADLRGEMHLQSYSGVIPSVPEPGTYALMVAGLAAVGVFARRRRAA